MTTKEPKGPPKLTDKTNYADWKYDITVWQWQRKVRYEQDDTAFRFGDGNVCVSKKLVYFPAVLGGREVTIKSSVVPNRIPLLLSKDSMAKAGFILDFGGGRVKIQKYATF